MPVMEKSVRGQAGERVQMTSINVQENALGKMAGAEMG